MNKSIGVVLSALMLLGCALQTGSSLGQSQVELGQVDWNRDLEAAKTLSSQTGKPLFVQFQEVPG